MLQEYWSIHALTQVLAICPEEYLYVNDAESWYIYICVVNYKFFLNYNFWIHQEISLYLVIIVELGDMYFKYFWEKWPCYQDRDTKWWHRSWSTMVQVLAWHQAIAWTTADLLLIGLTSEKWYEIFIKIRLAYMSIYTDTKIPLACHMLQAHKSHSIILGSMKPMFQNKQALYLKKKKKKKPSTTFPSWFLQWVFLRLSEMWHLMPSIAAGSTHWPLEGMVIIFKVQFSNPL